MWRLIAVRRSLSMPVLVFACCTWAGAFAFGGTFPFVHYTINDGLPQSSVVCMAQDHDGYMWFGTQSGLSRFDGVHFVNFTLDEGLPECRIVTLYEDGSKRLWVGTLGRGAYYYEGGLWHGVGLPRTGPAYSVPFITEDSNGRVWFCTDSGLATFQGGDTLVPESYPALAFPFVTCVARDRRGNPWFGTNGSGVVHFDGRAWKRFTSGDGLPSDAISGLAVDGKGAVWASTATLGNAVLEGGLWRRDAPSAWMAGRPVIGLYCDLEGRLWHIVASEGAFCETGGSTVRVSRSEGLLRDEVLSIFQDREKNLWFGTIAGACMLSSFKFVNYSLDHGIPNKTVWGLMQTRSGEIWAGCQSGGPVRLENGSWGPVPSPDWMKTNTVRCMLEARDGRVFVGTTAGLGVRKNGEWSRFDTSRGLPGNRVLCMVEGPGDAVYIGTGGGLAVAGPDGAITPFGPPGNQNPVACLLLDRSGKVWAGGQSGLIVLEGGVWSRKGEADGLAYTNVLSLAEAPGGAVWAGTSGGGLFRYDGARFHQLGLRDGLSNNFCYFILPDGPYLYVGTNRGLNRVGPGGVKVFTPAEGLATMEMNLGACMKDGEGYIWIGTMDGVSRFEPSLDRPNGIPPVTHITGLRVFDRTHRIDRPIELKYYDNFVRFEYTGVTFRDPKGTVYRYRLVGVSENWTETPDRSVSFSSLSPGKYAFEVNARNSDGVAGNAPSTIELVILPPFWATWWFRAVMAGLCVVALLAVRRIEMKNIKSRSAIEEEFRLAGEIQKRLLPESPPEIEGYDICGVSVPARAVGGDYFDFIPLTDGRLGICVADVSGKGLPAALLMANIQAVMRSQALFDAPLEVCLQRANALVCRSTNAERFVTLFYGILNPREHSFDYSDAGHNPPLLIKEGGGVVAMEAGGPILGVFRDTRFECGSSTFEPRDVAVLFSDGITEAEGPRSGPFGENRLAEIVRKNSHEPAIRIVGLAMDAVRRHSDGSTHTDDMTLVVVKRK